jgi:hypothetical protein
VPGKRQNLSWGVAYIVLFLFFPLSCGSAPKVKYEVRAATPEASAPVNDLSVFYYTYSTVPQTLAGAFAILTAVVVYQMQSIGASLRSMYEHELKTFWAIPNDFHVSRDADRWDELGAVLPNLCLRNEDLRARLDLGIAGIQATFLGLVGKRNAIRDDMRMALIVTWITIGVSFLLQFLAPELGRFAGVGRLVLFLDVAAGVVCIVLYGRLIWDVVRDGAAEASG